MFGCASSSLSLLETNNAGRLTSKRIGLKGLNQRPFGSMLNRKRSFDSLKDSRPRKTRKTTVSESGMTELPLLRGPNPLARFKQNAIPLAPFEKSEGMHPSLFDAKTEIGNLTKKLNKVEEQSQFWRRKSYTLQGELAKCRKEVSELRVKVDSMERQRLELQTKLLSANSDSAKCMEGIKALMAQNQDLKGVVHELNEELKARACFEPAVAAASGVSPDQQHLLDLETALADTLADLSEKIEEIDLLKKALEKVSVEKHNLDEVVTKDMLLKEMITLTDDAQADPEGNPEMAKIIRLQEAVEKCMFRIALLSQKNEELKGPGASKTFSPTLLETLEDEQKVTVLESMCMQRYRKLLRATAESLVGKEIDQMDESF